MRGAIWRGLIIALVMEAITVAVRFAGHVSAVEFNRTAPLALQIHHMFWAVPVIGVAMVVRENSRAAMWLAAFAIGCVVSDLSHHFIVLPMLVGNTGWHWP